MSRKAKGAETAENPNMIDELGAFQAAIDKFSAFYKDASERKPRLEEIQLTDDNKYWLVTLSFLEFPEIESKRMKAPSHSGSASVYVLDYKPSRILRTFKLDSTSGKLRSMQHPEMFNARA